MSTIETVRKTPEMQRWTVDPGSSTAEFEVSQARGLSAVTGRFRRFGGWYVVRRGQTELELAVDATSVDTGNAMRDEHLLAGDFFDADQRPWIRFTSTRVVHLGRGDLHVSGLLLVAGKQVPVGAEASWRQFGDELEMEATATVDQRDLGMSNGPLRSIRPPTKLQVKARLVPSSGLFG